MNDQDDLFELRPGMVHTPDHDTSVVAAKTVVRRQGTIRWKVEQFALSRGYQGFIDEDLRDQFGVHHPESSFRKRRTELAQDGVILDSGHRRPNRNKDQCVIWVHKNYALDSAKRIDPPKHKVPGNGRTEHETLALDALLAIASGGEPRILGEAMSEDDHHVVFDRCAHGPLLCEDCDECLAMFALDIIEQITGERPEVEPAERGPILVTKEQP